MAPHARHPPHPLETMSRMSHMSRTSAPTRSLEPPIKHQVLAEAFADGFGAGGFHGALHLAPVQAGAFGGGLDLSGG